MMRAWALAFSAHRYRRWELLSMLPRKASGFHVLLLFAY